MYLRLTNKEKMALSALQLKRSSNLRIRAKCVLLASEVMIADEISERTGYCAQSVRNWINRYKAEGINGLYERKHTGRKSTKANIIKQEINELLSKSAEDYGYQDANWTISLLIDYFSKKGCDASKDTFRRVLKAEGWCYKRLSKVPPKDGPTKEEKAIRTEEIITAIKQDQEEEESVTILAGDECHFSIQPYVQRGWCRIGEKTKVGTSKKKESCTIFGALNLKTEKCYWKSTKSGNSETFIAFLHQLHQAFPIGLIVLILDNATLHKSKKVKAFLHKHQWIKIYHITPYSPELNPIERFWGWLKNKVYGKKTFSNLTALLSKVRRLFWHFNEKNLVKNIKFSFNIYNELL